MRPLSKPGIALGTAYGFGIAMLGPLLGSTADASTAYAAHFGEDANIVRDLIGSVALVTAAMMLAWTVVVARYTSEVSADANRDLLAAVGLVTSSAMVVAAGLLATVPLTTAIGKLTGDPGIDLSVQAGIAQAGSVVLFVDALSLAVTTVLLGRLGIREGSIPRWVWIASWPTAGTLLLGASVGLLLPFAVWAIVLGLTWSIADP